MGNEINRNEYMKRYYWSHSKYRKASLERKKEWHKEHPEEYKIGLERWKLHLKQTRAKKKGVLDGWL